MTYAKKMILVLSILISGMASAQDEDVKIIPKQDGVLEDSSEHNRMGKQYYLGIKLLGLQAGYYLDRNSLLLVELSTERRTGFREASRDTLSLAYKHFTGNSFYYRTGIDYASVSSSYSNSFGESYRLKGSRVSGSVAIGNQWQWENFTLGVDWVGVTAPLFHNISESSSSGGSFEVSELESETNHWLKYSSIHLLNLNLGWSF